MLNSSGEKKHFISKIPQSPSVTDISVANEREKCSENMLKDRRLQEEEIKQERERLREKLTGARRNQDGIVKNRRLKLIHAINEIKKSEIEKFRKWRVQVVTDMAINTKLLSEIAASDRKKCLIRPDLDDTQKEEISKCQKENTEVEKNMADEILMKMYKEVRKDMAEEKALIDRGISKVKQQQTNHFGLEQKNALDVMDILVKMQSEHKRLENERAKELMGTAMKVQNEHKEIEGIRLQKMALWPNKTNNVNVQNRSLKMMAILQFEKEKHLWCEQERMKDAIRFVQQQQKENLKKECLVLQGNAAMLMTELKHLVKEEAMSQLSLADFRKMEMDHADVEAEHSKAYMKLFESEIEKHIKDEKDKFVKREEKDKCVKWEEKDKCVKKE